MRIYGLDFPIYQPVISTLLPLILSSYSTFKWHSLQQSCTHCSCCCCCRHSAGPLIKHYLLWPPSITALQLNYYSGPLSSQSWRKGELHVRTLLLRQMTGHRLHPTVQQQHRQPQRSHFTLTGKFFLRQAFTRLMLVLNSSGATCERRETQRKSMQRKTIGKDISSVKQ